MPEKSIREMSELERKYYSLEARIFHATIIGSAILGLVAFIIGLGLYVYALSGQYFREAFQLSKNAAAALTRVTDVQTMAERTMEIYRGQTEEELQEPFTDSHRERFSEIQSMPEYQTAIEVFKVFLEESGVSDLYLAMYDPDTSALVYIADPDEEYVCLPGDTDEIEDREMNRFLNWNGEGQLYDVSNTDKYGWLCTAGVPLRDESGDIYAFVLSDITLQEVTAGMKSFVLQYFIAMSLATIIFAVLLNRRMKKTLVRPINKIAEAAQSYVADKRAGESSGTHFAKLDIHTGDEIENLSLIMADMEHELGSYMENLTAVTAEKERVSTELSMATQIQEGMLPSIFPAFPDRPEFDIYASMAPAREVGGDFYDFFLIDEDHLCMVIADVSGKGVPAALFMMASKILINNLAMIGKSPAEILEGANDAICSNNRMEMFVTVWLGILEISTGKITAANAGHEYPAVMHVGGEFELLKDKHGFIIGGMENMKYSQYELQIEPGARLFLYTDGVPEATAGDGSMFGTDRMLIELNRDKDSDPKQILAGMKSAVEGFVKDAEQFDDMTMLCLEYKGGGKT